MKGALEALSAQACNVALAIVLVAAWLFLNAVLDGPSETDSLQVTAEISNQIAADVAAEKGQ